MDSVWRRSTINWINKTVFNIPLNSIGAEPENLLNRNYSRDDHFWWGERGRPHTNKGDTIGSFDWVLRLAKIGWPLLLFKPDVCNILDGSFAVVGDLFIFFPLIFWDVFLKPGCDSNVERAQDGRTMNGAVINDGHQRIGSRDSARGKCRQTWTASSQQLFTRLQSICQRTTWRPMADHLFCVTFLT